ncbi:MAG: hypothetical protein ACXIUD_07280 [Mongoliitalea sp.]
MKYFKYIGIIKDVDFEKDKIQQFSDAPTIKVALRYLDYLKEIDSYQKERRNTIETKNSQLVGQASIVASIFALFVPLLIDSFNGITLIIKIPLTLVFLFVLSHYLLTIFHATKTLKINKYQYATRGTTTVTKKDRAEKELDFLNEEIRDLNFIVNQTAPIDNIKGENLIFGARCFEIANFGFGIMTVLIILSTFLIKKDPIELKILNLKDIQLEMPDTLNSRSVETISTDTIMVKIDSTKIIKMYKKNDE